MRLAIFLLLALAFLEVTASYKRIKDYNQYLERWKEVVPSRYIHDVSHLASNNEQCYGKKCQYFYYEYEDESFRDEAQRRTILMVSGMHGNEYIGPHTLLYGYGHFKAYRIIYFPMANPSGFNVGKRETVPGQVDPNRDYPIDGNTDCYLTVAAHILDLLFRKYKFDLTMVLHNGGTEIGFNWGTFTHKQNSHTEDYDISSDIAKMLKRVGGKNEGYGLTEFKVGTMDEVVFSATGTFDDWAYAIGKYPSIITSCRNFKYQEYPKGMANGLVFLLQMGPFVSENLGSEAGVDSDPLSKKSDNGFAARGIRMLKGVLDVVHPRLNFVFENTTASVTVQGCKTAQVSNLTMFVQYEGVSWSRIYQGHETLSIQGNLGEKEPTKTVLSLTLPIVQGSIIKYEGTFECDKDWNGKGTTAFASPRIFTLDLIEPVTNKRHNPVSSHWLSTLDFSFDWSDLKEYSIYILLALLFLFSLLAFLLFRKCKKVKIQKFQEVEYASEQHTDAHEGEEQMEGDLHTARGGIVSM